MALALAPVFAAQAEDLWNGLAAGPHAVGFRFERRIDESRTVETGRRGTPLGLAVWYPAQRAGESAPLTQLDYRLLAFSREVNAAARQSFLDSEAEMMAGWRHVGIVPLTLDQARAALTAPGRAHRGAAPVSGKFPIVLVTSPAYLSTNAENLASHGRIVVAPARFSDASNEAPPPNFLGYVETSIRDMEWALSEISRDPAADPSNVAVMGHGGGGFQALLLGMRNRAIRAVINIDAGIFSARTNPRQQPFYDPRLLRVPYLYITTAENRRTADQWADFEAMRFSRRHEVVLADPELRHHDLSDYGRAVSAVLGIRGAAQSMVLRRYAEVQQTIVRFLNGDATLGAVSHAIDPAPTTVQVIESLSEGTPKLLADARRRDPEAPIFSEDDLRRIVEAARGQVALAAGLGRFALAVHPNSAILHRAAAEVAAAPAAREIYTRCAALPEPQNDWRASRAHAVCRARAAQ